MQMAFYYLKINIQCGLEYPAYLIGWFISNPLQFLFGLITIQVVIANFQPLGGWSFDQMVFLYGLGTISHGLSVVLFIQTWYMDYLITQGEMDRLFVRPLNVFFQFCFMEFNFIGFTDLIPGIVMFAYGCAAVGFPFTPLSVFQLLLVIVGATALRGGIYTMSGSLAFWTQRSHMLVDVHLRLFDSVNRYPMNIYPRALQALFTFLLPIGFISFYPARAFLGIDGGFRLPGNLCVWTFFVGIGFYWLSVKVFQAGMKRYESAGS